jgi:hypothetical protein
MSHPLQVGLPGGRSRLPRDAVTVPAAEVAVVTVLRLVAAVTELLQPADVELAADAVEQLRLQPVRCCPRTAVSPRR